MSNYKSLRENKF